jgi:hypothetical protein
MNKWARITAWIFEITSIPLLTGCPGKGPSADSAPGSSSAAAAPSAARAGYITGKITRADGSPIGIPGAHMTVGIDGVAGIGNNVEYAPQVADDGTFSTPVASGIYHQAQATLRIPFNGSMYIYGLVPTTMMGDMQSDPGIVANFAWHISGPVWMYKDNPDPTNFTNWYGGSCTLQWDNIYPDARGALQQFAIPVDAAFDFTATPIGKAIDGSDPKPRAWQSKWAAMGLTVTVLNDMPATSGGWHITGKETDPDGKTYPVIFELAINRTKLADSVDVQFKPTINAQGFWPPPLMITRAAP